MVESSAKPAAVLVVFNAQLGRITEKGGDAAIDHEQGLTSLL
jgi:hypothetical protein